MKASAFTNFESAYRGIIQDLREYGQEVSPRGIKTKEIAPYSFTIENPRCRVLTWDVRNWREYIAVGEFIWIMSGSNRLNHIVPFNRAWSNFSDDDKFLYGAYGSRLICPLRGNQIARAITMLKNNKDSRQVLLNIHRQEDLFHVSKDIPCTSSLQFMVRDNKLQCTAYMRSNDVILGTAYDVFVFTMIQEYIAIKLGIELGKYTHIAGSMHIYEHHWDTYFKECDILPLVNDVLEMNRMTEKNADATIELYRNLVEKKDYDFTATEFDEYWKKIYYILYQKYNNYVKEIQTGIKTPYNSLIREICHPKVGGKNE